MLQKIFGFLSVVLSLLLGAIFAKGKIEDNKIEEDKQKAKDIDKSVEDSKVILKQEQQKIDSLKKPEGQELNAKEAVDYWNKKDS